MPDFRNSISDRDERVSASQQLFDDLDAREATRGEVTADDFKSFLHDPFSREEAVALRPFFDAFCEGRAVFRYECKTRHGRPMHVWQAIHEFDFHDKPHCLSLTYRTDNPFAADEPTFHASHEALPTTGTTSDGAATALRGDAVE